MALALSLGRRGLGRVWPNPAVGCVIVKEGRVIARGRTADGGRPHAETVALAQAGAAARGATAYVTLEPCAHHGHTPPCADALISAGVARVVVACSDPDTRVAGQGIARLRVAGIDVEVGVLAEQAARDHSGFFGKLTGRPFLTLKLASTLDGRIATASGESQWITGPEARRAVHAMRARHDAVMVGAGTVRADDPMLNVRGMGSVRQPVRVVLSRHLDLPLDSALARSAGDIPLWVLHGGANPDLIAAWEGMGAICVACPIRGRQIDLTAAMSALAERGLTRVFCEGGGALAAGLLADNLVDDLVVFSAGKVLGAEAVPSLGPLGISRLGDAPGFSLAAVRPIGADVLIRWSRLG